MTKETDYAIRILSSLEKHGRLSAKKICELEFLPLQFSYNILRKLERGELIRIIRGAQGGYELLVDLKTYSLLDLMKIVNDDYLICECMKDGFECKRKASLKGACKANLKLCQIQLDLLQALGSTKLIELVN